MTKTTSAMCLFLVGEGVATGALRGRRLAKLIRDLEAGRGGETLTALVMSGYRETMGGQGIDGLTAESVRKEASGDMTTT